MVRRHTVQCIDQVSLRPVVASDSRPPGLQDSGAFTAAGRVPRGPDAVNWTQTAYSRSVSSEGAP